MEYEEMQQRAYEETKSGLDKVFTPGAIPNINAIKKIIADLRKRINILQTGAILFATSLDEVDKVNLQMERLSGQLQAYQERYDWIKEKLKEAK